MGPRLTRRNFTVSLSALAATRLLPAQSPTARIDVAKLEGDRILAAANSALKQPINLFSTLPSPHKSKQDFHSELPPDPTPDAKPKPVFRDHAIALRQFSNIVAELTAAYVVTHDNQYALRAGQHLYAWLVDPTTRMNPNLTNAGFDAAKATGTPAGIVDAAPLAELARSLSFLVDTAALSPPDLTSANDWLKDLQQWLNTNHNATVAREEKDHTASAWLLLSTAIARATRDDNTLDACRHRFRKPTLRNQINAEGAFPHEVLTAFPYRNTLFNFDLLAGVAQLVSTQFEDLWQFELEDGVGMRSVSAYLFPILTDTHKWPRIADPINFREVPTHRPALLFAGRAYNRSEYINLWRNTPTPDLNTLPEHIAATFPITQPLLWTAKAPHGL